MRTIRGQGVFDGIAFGKILYFQRGRRVVARKATTDSTNESGRFLNAKHKAVKQLAELRDKAKVEAGEKSAALFDIHQMMLEDLDYVDTILETIADESVNAEYAVERAAEKFALLFTEMDDPYMRERAVDVRDISNRLLDLLMENAAPIPVLTEPVIIIADDLTPSETVQMDKSLVLAFVTSGGSASSHTAILARTMGIPAIIGAVFTPGDEHNGLHAVVDGFTGEMHIEPDAAMEESMRAKARMAEIRKTELDMLRGQPAVTLDGQRVLLYANIGNPGDVSAVLESNADGIGLFRSEFLYLESSDYPSEDKQFYAYKAVAEKMAGKRVVIRTLDIGADKRAEYFQLPTEENPALGMRAIRLCLSRADIFETQLRALYRASAFGKIAIMFPLITSVWEVLRIKEIAGNVRADLQREGIAFSENVELGIMIETPAAAVISDRLAGEVDFFSIGTNDLIQYTLAVDRQNQALEQFCDTHHEAVLRLIRMVAESGRKAGIWTGICGELAADTSMTEAFLAMGIDELSVSMPYILPLLEKIRNIDVSKILSHPEQSK